MRTLSSSLSALARLAAFAGAGLIGFAALGHAAEPAKPASNPAAPTKPATVPATAPAMAPTASAAPAAPTVDTAKFPDVVAIVNGYALSKQKLLGQIGGLLRPGQTPTIEMYRGVVDQMVGTRLLYEESRALKLEPADIEVEKAYQSVRQRFPGSDEDFAKQAQSQGLTLADLKEGIRENMAIGNLVAKQVEPTVAVSEAEAQKFYDQNQDRMQRPEQVKVSHILVAVKSDASPADKAAAKKKAEDVLAKLKAGGNFAELAKANSDDGSKATGGELGWISKGQTVPPFEAAAFALKPGETSGVVESQFGFHVIRVAEHRAGGKAPFADAKDQITAYLKNVGIRDALVKHVAELRSRAKVEVKI